MVDQPSPSDPEVAAAVFAAHLDQALASDFAAQSGWTATRTGPLEAIVHMTGVRADGGLDEYHLRLRADHYDEWPPDAAFVAPANTERGLYIAPGPTSPWLPKVDNSVFTANRFAYHPLYTFPDESKGQLVCCSMSFGYYISNHAPTPGQHWRQGRHTLIALLNRVQEALLPPAYQGRLGAVDS